jgi:hypothetical protein
LLTGCIAAIFGLQEDVGLHGTQYSWLSALNFPASCDPPLILVSLGSIFYFGYLVVGLPHPSHPLLSTNMVVKV